MISNVISDIAGIIKGEFATDAILTKDGIDVETRIYIKNITDTVEYDDGSNSSLPFAHCTLVEEDLNNAGITTRDSNGDCSLTDMLISTFDTSGERLYEVVETKPDSTTGGISCVLQRKG